MGSQPVAVTQVPINKSVSTTHADYDENLDDWVQCRDVISGARAVKDKGEDYLPKLSGQDSDEYEAYKTRALFFGAVKRTVKGMTGMVFRKEPVYEGIPDNLLYLLQDITFTGVPMYGFAKDIFNEVMSMGRVGIWVDMPKKGAPEQRPYLIMYQPEQILNWRAMRINGKMTTTMIVLSENYEEPYETDPFAVAEYTQYRVLMLDQIPEEADTGMDIPGKYRYKVQVYREITEGDSKSKGSYYLYEETFPLRNGQPLNEIPFVIVGPESCGLDIQPSPILDMVDVVLSHYRTSADLENGRHWCGIPQPYLAGFPDKPEWQIGGSRIWSSSDPNAKASFLEFTGQGLGALEKAIEEKEEKLAVLGMRILETAKKASEKPEALKLRMLGDVSVLQAVARTVSQGLTLALGWALEWMSASSENLVVQLNQDYDEEGMTSQDLQALIAAWQGDAISYRTLYANLEKGEYTREGIDVEDELEEIQMEKEERAAMTAESGIEPPPPPNQAGAEGESEDTGEEGDTGEEDAGDAEDTGAVD